MERRNQKYGTKTKTKRPPAGTKSLQDITSLSDKDEGIRALIIADSIAQAEEGQKLINNTQCKDYVKLVYPSALGKEKATIDNLLEDCKRTVEEDGDIDAIVTTHKEYCLLQSILINDLKLLKQKVPSFQSLALCLHKYYTINTLLREFKLVSKKIDIDDADSYDQLSDDIASAVEETDSPAILMDAFATEGAFAKKITLEKLPPKELKAIRETVTINSAKYRKLFEDYMPFVESNYPYMLDSICLVNAYWKAYDGDVTIHQAECCVSTNSRSIEDQELVRWILTDMVYCKGGKRRSLMYVGVPSKLSASLSMDVWAVLREVYTLLVQFGFMNYFFNAIVVVSSNGDVKVADVNSGILKDNTELYKHVLIQGDNVKASIDAGFGKMQRTPSIRHDTYAMRAELRTYMENVAVDNVIDLKAARSISNVELHVHHSDEMIVHDLDEGGMHLASVYLKGQNEEDCLNAFSDICDMILKTKSKMNWNLENLSKKSGQLKL